jgi:hypothetical protein
MMGSLSMMASPAAAQSGIFAGMQAGVEAVFSTASTRTTFANGLVTDTTTSRLYPVFTANVNTLLYPSLRLNAGGTFEIDQRSTTTGPLSADSTITRSRPFLLLRSVDPVLSPGFGLFRREAVTRTAGLPDLKLVNDEYAGYLGWNPAGGPRSYLQFIRTNTYDGDRTSQDITKDLGSLASTLNGQRLSVNYRGTYLRTNDRIGRLDTRQMSHGGRVDFVESYFENRLRWNAMVNVDHLELTATARGEDGEVDLPVTPFAGLSAVSDTPATVTLSDNGQLIDGNLTAGAGLNLGLPPSPIEAQFRNIGLDLLTPAEVNRLLVWVDRELPLEVSDSFSWEVYSSQDNILWRQETLVPSARFGPFEHRFEIAFPAVTARYLKVVTRPLSPVVPDASRYTEILVTELQAFVRQPASAVGSRLTRDSYLVNTDVRLRILDSPGLNYEGLYLANGTRGLPGRTETLSNGLSLNHTFGRIFSLYARGAHERGEQVEGPRVATVSSATFTVEPIPTFRSSVLYSGLDERIGGLPRLRRGVFVQNAAQPYAGIDVLFGVGWTYIERETGDVVRERYINTSATIVPDDHISVTLAYDDRHAERSGMATGDTRYDQQRLYAAVAFNPTRALHLVLGGEVFATTNQTTRTALNVGTSWTPFPDGTLRFVFAYDETLRALEFGQQRSMVTAVRWKVSGRSYVDLSFQKLRSALTVVTTESRIVSLRVRLFL